jgi:hypothetical protein
MAAAALLGLMARGRERHFADHVSAQAVCGYDGYWHEQGEVIATWLARAVSEPWLPNASGALRAPLELHISSEANRLTVGTKPSLYLMSVGDQVLQSPALAALRIRRGPSVSSIVAKLEELRDDGKTGTAVEEQARTGYRILALACPPDGGGQRPVDDMTVGQLRSRFAGLLEVGGRQSAERVAGFVDRRDRAFCESRVEKVAVVAGHSAGRCDAVPRR